MKQHIKILILFLIISFNLSTPHSALSNDKEKQIYKEIITEFIGTCGDTENIQSLGFAPINKKENRTSGEFAYEFLEKNYPYETFPIGDNKYSDKIWFYSNIKQDGNGEVPDYLWHLIISPAPKVPQADKAEAFLVNFDSKSGDIDKLDLLKRWDERLLQDSIVENSNPVIYTNNELTNAIEKADLDSLWQSLIKNKNMNLILFERERRMRSTERVEAYDYTFYLHEIGAKPDNINKIHGYRIVSSKIITSPGQVYGFVLNEDGSCLDYKDIMAK